MEVFVEQPLALPGSAKNTLGLYGFESLRQKKKHLKI